MLHDMLIGLAVILAASALAQGLRTSQLSTESDGSDRPPAGTGLISDKQNRPLRPEPTGVTQPTSHV